MAKFDSDKWLAISAIVVSVGTLAALAYQSMLMRDSERASKLPYLYISLQSNEQANSLELTNSGIGPALIDEVHVEYKGKTLPTDGYDFVVAQHLDFTKYGLGVDKIQKGRLIPAGTTIRMVEFGRARDGLLAGILGLFEIAEVPRDWYMSTGTLGGDKAVLVITYTSVFGERWRVRSDRIVPDAL